MLDLKHKMTAVEDCKDPVQVDDWRGNPVNRGNWSRENTRSDDHDINDDRHGYRLDDFDSAAHWGIWG